jgi:hypothetical protein
MTPSQWTGSRCADAAGSVSLLTSDCRGLFIDTSDHSAPFKGEIHAMEIITLSASAVAVE